MASVHRLIGQWMRELGMSIRVDAAGNLIGRRHAGTSLQAASRGDSSDASVGPGQEKKRVLLLGSHLDTVPNAGKYDGILGVMIGLAVVESLGQTPLAFDIDVIGLSEEEGVRYATPYLGSRAIAGTFDTTWFGLYDDSAITMRQAIATFGLDPDAIGLAAYDPVSVIGFIEPHIEQGPVLERAGVAVGVVTQIVGQSRLVVHFRGEAGHAGTTPMIPRKDALVPAARLVAAVQEIGQRVDGLRATVGRLVVHPNASNVIPADVDVSLDIRHASDSVRLAVVDELIRIGTTFAASENVQFSVTQRNHTESVEVSQRLAMILKKAVADRGFDPMEMVSGAGHDAVVMAARFPIAMLFLRHPGGISHHPDERVDVEDVGAGIAVLESFVHKLSSEESEP
jgi:allantoate deiminase